MDEKKLDPEMQKNLDDLAERLHSIGKKARAFGPDPATGTPFSFDVRPLAAAIIAAGFASGGYTSTEVLHATKVVVHGLYGPKGELTEV